MGCGFTVITVIFASFSDDACYLLKSGLAVRSSSMKRKIVLISKENCWHYFLIRGRIFGTWKNAGEY